MAAIRKRTAMRYKNMSILCIFHEGWRPIWHTVFGATPATTSGSHQTDDGPTYHPSVAHSSLGTAGPLHVQQPAIAKMEKRTDMYLSTLRSHIEAMHGQLEIVARFPDGAVQINDFAELGKSAAT